MKKFIAIVISLCAIAFTYLDGLEKPEPNVMIEGTDVYFLDVGQGDASLILTGDDAILIDGGKNDFEEGIVEFIKSKGVSEIDLIIATHPHEDHIGGLDAVIENFEVNEILMPDKPYNTKTYEEVITAANDRGTAIIYPEDKDYFEYKSGLLLELLTPSSDFESSNTNDDSIVCEVHIGETSILYTGDMEKALEDELMHKFSDVDILKVGHHGSDTSTSDEFLARVKPEIAVISCGEGNSYGHPHSEILDKLKDIDVRRTDLDGDISFSF